MCCVVGHPWLGSGDCGPTSINDWPLWSNPQCLHHDRSVHYWSNCKNTKDTCDCSREHWGIEWNRWNNCTWYWKCEGEKVCINNMQHADFASSLLVTNTLKDDELEIFSCNSGIEILATQMYCPPWDVRRGLKVRLRVLFPPDTVLVSLLLVPFTTSLPSFIHTTSGTTTSPSTTFTVHTSEYTDPAVELPYEDVVITGGGRAGGER